MWSKIEINNGCSADTYKKLDIINYPKLTTITTGWDALLKVTELNAQSLFGMN